MNKKSSKLLAAVAVFAMVACVFATVPMVADDVSADQWTDAANGGESLSALKTAISGIGEKTAITYSGTTLNLNELGETETELVIPVPIKFTSAVTITIPAGKTLSVSGTAAVDTAKEFFAVLKANDTLTVEGTGAGTGVLKVSMDGEVKIVAAGEEVKASAIEAKTFDISGVTVQIDVTTKTSNPDNLACPQAIYGIRNVASGSANVIGDESIVTNLDIDVAVDDKLSFGIFSGVSRAGQDLTISNTNGHVNAGNRAIHAMAKLTFDKNTDLDISASERGIRATTVVVGTTSDLTDATVLDVTLSTDIGYNGGTDDRFGIIATTVTVYKGAVLNTAGLKASTITNTGGSVGAIVVSGGYTQNPDSDIPMKIAGLYYEGTDVLAVTKVASASKATSAGVYIISGAETFGAIAVQDATGTTAVVTEGAATITGDDLSNTQTKLDTLTKDCTKYTLVTTGTVSLVDDAPLIIPKATAENPAKVIELIATEGKAFTGTIAIGDGADPEAAGPNSVKLTNFVGALSIKEGSIYINGTIVAGNVEFPENDVKLTEGGITVDGSGAKLILNGTLTPNGHKIELKNGGCLVLGGTEGLVIDGSVEIVGDGTGSVITGQVASGTIILSAAEGVAAATAAITLADTSNAFTVGKDAKMTVKNGAIIGVGTEGLTIDGSATINGTLGGGSTGPVVNNGTITLYGILDGGLSDNVTNNKTIVLASEDAQISGVKNNGTIDTSAITKEGVWSGSYSSATYGIQQQITVTGETEITSKALIVFQGTLIVNEGQTLTIRDGAKLVFDGAFAKLINNGTIIVESDVDGDDFYKPAGDGVEKKFSASTIDSVEDNVGGLVIAGATVENYGTITAKTEDPNLDNLKTVINIASGTVDNYGTITIDEDNVLDITAKLNNKSGATVELYGDVDGSGVEINNEGTVVIDNESTGPVTIHQLLPNAAVSIIKTGATVTIDDDGMVMGKIDGVEWTVGKNGVTCNEVEIDPNDNCVAGGVVITSEAVKEENDKDEDIYVNMMVIAGNLDASAMADADSVPAEPGADLTITGTASVTDALALAEGITVTGGILEIDGTASVAEGAVITATALDVDGEVVASAKDTNAIASLTSLTVTGKLTITGKDVYNTGNEKINASKYIVKPAATSTESTVYYYSGFKAAIEGAVAASVKEVLAYGAVDVDEDVSIPAGLAVKYNGTAGTNALTVEAEKTLTVEATGKLNATGDVIVKGTLYVVDEKTGINKSATITSDVMSRGVSDVRYTSLASAIAAAGATEVTIKLNNETTVSADLTIPKNITVDTNDKKLTIDKCKLTIDGTLYLYGGDYALVDSDDGKKKASVVLNGYIKSDSSMTFDNKKYPAGVQYEDEKNYFITSLNNIAVAIAADADQNVYVYGAVSADNISVAGTADKPVTVIFRSSDVALGEDVNTVKAGTITIDYATINFDDDREIAATIAGPTGSVQLAGAIVNTSGLKFIASEDSDDAKTFTVTGDVLPATTTVAGQTKDVTSYKFIVNDTVVLENLKTYDHDGIGMYGLVIDGTAVVAGDSDLNEVLVNGTMTVDHGADVDVVTATVLGTIKVLDATADGTKTSGDLDVTYLYVGFAKTETGATAVIEGTVAIGTNGFAAVVAGSQISEDTLEEFKDYGVAEFDLDGVKTTVYFPGTEPSFEDVFGDATVKDAFFTGWESKDGTVITDMTETIDNGESYVSKVIADVYLVTITTVDGISNVTIDGQLMTKVDNSFTAIVAAGPHSIAYTLAAGYEGTATLASKDTTVSGMSFTTEGTPKAIYDMGVFDEDGGTSGKGFDYIEYNLQLTGITVKDTSASTGGMGLTEILLIVLVVLIAIMAVVIAMRMMRS